MRHARVAPILLVIVTVFYTLAAPLAAETGRPLPSWAEGANRQAILAFVAAVTEKDGKDFVPPDDRVAVFDMDGTLVVETPKPAVLVFALQYLATLGKANPALDMPLLTAIRDQDTSYLTANLVQVLTAAGAGLTETTYNQEVTRFARGERHPTLKRPYDQLFYAPMLELVRYLDDHGFRVYIVSGSSQAFARAFAARATGIPVGRIIGTQTVMFYYNGEFILQGAFRDLATVGTGKPLAISYQIGQTPIFAFGNTAGDQDMLAMTLGNRQHRTLALWLDHDDQEREHAAYEGGVKSIDGLLRVSMRNDFLRLFNP